MANIGTFTTQNGSYTGTVRTLTLNVKARLVPSEKASENARTTASSQAMDWRSAQRGRNSARGSAPTCP